MAEFFDSFLNSPKAKKISFLYVDDVSCGVVHGGRIHIGPGAKPVWTLTVTSLRSKSACQETLC